MNIVGQPLSRVDGRLKVTGQARYAGEQDIARLAYGVLVGSAISKGRIRRIDTTAARAAPGVAFILTHDDMPRLSPPGDASAIFSMPGEDRFPLQDDRIHHAGQHIALVVAGTLEQAWYAASMVVAEYEEEKPAVSIEAARGQAYRPESFLGMEGLQYGRGDVRAGFDAASRRIEAEYGIPVEHHNAMEPHATVAAWEGGKLTLYDATQAVMGTQTILAGMLGIKPEDVRVVCPFVGGGFGCKGFIWGHSVLAAVAARMLGRPVKIVLDRRQTFTSVGHRARTIQKVGLAAGEDGVLEAVRHETATHQSEIGEFIEPPGLTTRLLYACPNMEVVHESVRLNVGTPTAMRAPGETPGTYALECAMDELAYSLGIDPVELRIRNHAAVDPLSGNPFSTKHLLDCYKIGAEAFGWSRRTPEPRSMRDGRHLVGMGMATSTYPGYRLPASAVARIKADGTAEVETATQDLGTGTYTSMTQVAADALGLPVERVRFALGDSSYPPAPTSGGSTTSASVGPAVLKACKLVQDEVARIAASDPRSPLHGMAIEKIVHGNGRMSVQGDPSRGEDYAEALRRAGRLQAEACVKTNVVQPHGGYESEEPGAVAAGAPCIPMKGLSDVDADRSKYAFQSFGAQFAEVRVDPDLGTVRVARVVSVQDIGRVLNRKTARSQVVGGVVFGIGMALTEETFYDPGSGRPVTRNLADYHVPANADVPEIDARFIDEQDPRIDPLGVRGVGEIGITGVAAAVANAVFHATGRRVRDLPITPDKLL